LTWGIASRGRAHSLRDSEVRRRRCSARQPHRLVLLPRCGFDGRYSGQLWSRPHFDLALEGRLQASSAVLAAGHVDEVMAVAPGVGVQSSHRDQHGFIRADEVDRQDPACMGGEVDTRPRLAPPPKTSLSGGISLPHQPQVVWKRRARSSGFLLRRLMSYSVSSEEVLVQQPSGRSWRSVACPREENRYVARSVSDEPLPR
jgi:hypothetical protein